MLVCLNLTSIHLKKKKKNGQRQDFNTGNQLIRGCPENNKSNVNIRWSLKRYLQSYSRYHILDDKTPYSKLCDTESFQTWKTAALRQKINYFI